MFGSPARSSSPPSWISVLCLALVALVALVGSTIAESPVTESPDTAVSSDWPRFRGPAWDGTAPAADAWTVDNPRLEILWTRPLGSGYAGAVIVDGRLYTAWGEGSADWLGAFDAATGEELWRLDLGPLYAGHDGSHDGPLATPVVADGRVVGLGGHGRMVAASLDGEMQWAVELSELGEKPFYGFTSSPTVADGRLVIEVAATGEGEAGEDGAGDDDGGGEGVTGAAVHGFDPATGEKVWSAGDGSVAYQSPIVASIGGERQLIATSGSKLFGLDPATGEVAWSWEHGGDQRAMGAASMVPVPVDDGRLLVQPEHRGVRLLSIQASDGAEATVEELWSSDEIGLSYGPPVIAGGKVFAHLRGFLTALDVETGTLVWKSRPPGDGFLAAAGDRVVVATKKGMVHLLDASADTYEDLTSIEVADAAVWSTPAIADGRIYVRSTGGLAAIEVRGGERAMKAVWPGHDLPSSPFAEWLRGLETAEDRNAAVEAYWDELEETPVVEGTWVHFLYRGQGETVGLSGDMFGDRTEEPMLRIPGTDLFYRSVELPRDAWVAYRLAPDFEDPVPDPKNPRQAAGMRGIQTSWVSMPDWRAPRRVEALAGALVEHSIEVVAPERPADAPAPAEDAPDLSTRRVDVLLPEAYDPATAEALPLILIFDGQSTRGAELEHYLEPLLTDPDTPDRRAIVAFIHEYPVRGPEGAAEDARTLFESVMPFLESTYALKDSPRAYIGMGFGGTMAGMVGLDPRADADRLVLVQPFFLDAQRARLLDAAEARTERRPAIHIERSTLDLRAEHEGWDVGEQAERLAGELGALGYEVELESTNNGFHWGAWVARAEAALDAALSASSDGSTSASTSASSARVEASGGR